MLKMCLKGITTLKFQFDQSYQYNNKYLYQPTISFSVFNEFGPFWIDQIRNFHLGCFKARYSLSHRLSDHRTTCWKGSWMQSHPPHMVKAESTGPGCSGTRPVQFWIFIRMENPPSFWVTCCSVQSCLQ